jgi:beta-lactamase class A
MIRRESSGHVAHAAASNRRLGSPHQARVERLDVLLIFSMGMIISAYALGYRLDWTAAPGLNLNEEEEDIPVQIEAPASLPVMTAAEPSPAMDPVPAAPAVSAEPAAPADEDWDFMTAELAKRAAKHVGRVSIVLKDLKTGRTWLHHPDDLYPAASLIKVPVMIATLYRISEGSLSLNDRLMLRRRVRVGGSGSLKWRPDGTRITVEELLIRMINESDNTATAMLLDAMGIGYVQQQFPRMGLLYTGIYPEGMSIKGGRVAHENYTTAREMTMLLEKIYSGEAVDKYSSSLMLGILKRPKAVPSRLAKGLPLGWEIAHKTGLLRMACHDSAIFFTPNGDYVMTVLTGQNRSYTEAKDFISSLAKTTFRHYTGTNQLARAAKKRQQVALR